MSFKDCIQTAIDTGRVTAAKGAEAHALYDKHYKAALASNQSPAAADIWAASKSLEGTTELKGNRRWRRINEMQRAHELHQRLIGNPDPARELQRIIEELEYTTDTVRSVAMAQIDKFMYEFKPQKAGFVVPERGLDDIERAAWGEPSTPAAKEIADSIIGVREMLRKWANMYGLNIVENDKAKIPQIHDSIKVQAVSEAEWIQDHMDNLDWDVMRYKGEEILPEDRWDILSKTYQGIINDGFDRGHAAQARSTGLTTKLNQERFLYYKDANSSIAMRKKYGEGNLYQQIIGIIEASAKDISLLKTFGPHPTAGKEFTKRLAFEQAATLNNLQKPGERFLVDQMKKDVTLFDDQYNIHAWQTTTADGNRAVSVFSTMRTLAINALLGGSLWPNLFGDMANAKAMRGMLGLQEVKVLRSYLAEVIPTEAKQREAAQMGVIMENAISLVNTRARYFGTLDGPHWARRISDITYRLGLASHHTQVARNAWGKQLLAVFANHADQKFDDLPFAAGLTEMGITPKDWDKFRTTPMYMKGKASFLRPLDMFDMAKTDGDKKIAMKFSNFMQMYMRTVVPDTSLRARRALGEAADQNSWMLQGWRTITALTSFPLSIYFNQLRRIAETPGIRNKLTLSAKYMFWMTMAGAAITQTKALVNGEQPHDMRLTDDEGKLNDFWFRAFVNGGSAGIAGDLIFNNVNLANSQYFRAGPVENYITKFLKLTAGNAYDAGKTLMYKQGLVEEPGRELKMGKDFAEFIDANIPDLWYTKLIIERAFRDEVMQQIDPAGWNKKQKYLRENTEGQWWEPDQSPTAPNLGTAVGNK